MNIEEYFQSLTTEFDSLKNRVRNFIQDAHWLTDGEWKESVLRSFLVRRLPETIKVGRGFVVTSDGPSSQCDILLYRASAPTLFKDGDLVFLTPDAVVGIIEVKSKTDSRTLRLALEKFAEIGTKLGSDRDCFFGLFSYETEIQNDQQILEALRDVCNHETKIVDMLSLGCHTFIRWWKQKPDGEIQHYERWHSYKLQNMSAGYFIANVLAFVCPEYVLRNKWLWFPEEGKESKKTDDIAYATGDAEDERT
ncbi:MAG: DUF6602 domain-containing protein [Sedimentisphaerales bacterium]